MTNKLLELRQQQNTVNLLYENLISKDHKILLLQGDSGTGKSTCVDILSNRLKESWTLFEIENPNFPIISDARLTTKIKKRISFSPALGLNVGIVSLNMGFGFKESRGIFSDIQQMFYKQIIKSNAKNALVIVEDYDRLDQDLTLFINTIIHFSNKIKTNIHFLLTGETFNNIFGRNDTCIIKLGTLENDFEFKQFVVAHKKMSDFEIEKIYKITNGNLSFIKNVLTDYDSDTIDNIILKRVEKHLNDDEVLAVAATEILTLGSFFKKGFTQKQIWGVFEYEEKQRNLLKIFTLLDNFILCRYSDDRYEFTLPEFKAYFFKNGKNLREYYFSALYNYFSERYDFDYEVRAYYLNEYLKLSQETNDKHSALFFLWAVENIYSGSITSVDQIEKLILYDKFDKEIQLKFNNIFSLILNIQKSDDKKNWSEVLNNLNKYSFDNPIIDCEIMRIKIEIVCRMTRSTTQMENLIKELLASYNIIIDRKTYFEFAHWIKISSTLISHLTNRANLQNELDRLISLLSKTLDEYTATNKNFALFYRNILNKKSVLYLHPDVAENKIYKAVNYFENKNNYELYKSYVNLLGTQIVLNKLPEGQQTLDSIEKLVLNNPDITFPQVRKLENNKLLLEYLDRDSDNLTKDFILKFKELSNKYSESNIIKMNYISMLLSDGDDAGIRELDAFINKNAQEYNEDNFYRFFLNDLKLSYEICIKNWTEAEKTLTLLQTIELPKFYGENYYCSRRLEAFKIIVNEKLIFNAKTFKTAIYDLLIKRKNFYGKDLAWRFFSRGFILSDYQFFI